jgi:hypothetical protein
MNVYLSWSGDLSRKAAAGLEMLLSITFQRARVFEPAAISSGARWDEEISNTIAAADVGITCVTPDNVNNPWLLFEAGALSTSTKLYVPFLIDLSPVDLVGPLARFQATQADEHDVWRLFLRINSVSGDPLDESVLGTVFRNLWPQVQRSFRAEIPLGNQSALPEQGPAPSRNADALMEDLSHHVKVLQQQLDELRKKVGERK